MASSGRQKWSKYFQNKTVKTTVMGKGNKPVSVYDLSGKKEVGRLNDGDPITVIPTDKYDAKYTIEAKIKSKKTLVMISGDSVAKPIKRKGGDSRLARLTATQFASKGKRGKIHYGGKDVEVITFKNPKDIEDSILKGLSDFEKDSDAGTNAFKAFFKGYNTIDWQSETSPEAINKYGVYIGEVLIGLLFLKGIQHKYLNPVPKRGKATAFHLPEDVSFSGVDSIVEFKNGDFLPISSKFGVGAKASLFSNILGKAIIHVNDLPKCVFRELAQSAIDAGITPEMLDKKRGSKDIVYQYGVHNILNIKRTGNNGVKDALKVFHDIRKDANTPEVVATIRAIHEFRGVESKIIDKLPDSVTSFFSRTIADRLNADKKSIDSMLEILAGKNYWQANLNIANWEKGKVQFRMVSTKKMKINVIGSKSAIDDITAKQGLVNYEIKTA